MDLSGVTVLDFTHLLPGPYATQLLADAGANVIKIEPPGGDPARHMRFDEERTGSDDRAESVVQAGSDDRADTEGPPPGTLFTLLNRGKQSVVLDLKAEGVERALEPLFDSADVVIEQYRPGVADRLGVGVDDVREHATDVVYCSLSGYGQTGARADRAGHDLNYVGEAGLLDATRPGPDEPPVIPGVPVADMAGGLVAAFSTVAALLSRELGSQTGGTGSGGTETGGLDAGGTDAGGTGAEGTESNGSPAGEYLDVSLTEAALSVEQVLAASALFGGTPRAGETVLTGGQPCYDVYECADGQYLTVAALERPFWDELCDRLDLPELQDRHLVRDPAVREAVREQLVETFRSRPRAAWLDRFDDGEVPVGPVRTVEEAMTDPDFRARGAVLDGDETIPPRLGFPAVGDVEAATAPPPDLGADTRAVFESAGLDPDEVESLAAAGVFGD